MTYTSAGELFAEHGAAVVIAERNADTGQATADQIRKAGGRALFVQTDVADEPSIQRMVEATVKTFGGINILVNRTNHISYHLGQLRLLPSNVWSEPGTEPDKSFCSAEKRASVNHA